DENYTGTITFFTNDPYEPDGMPSDHTFTTGNKGNKAFQATLYTVGSWYIKAWDKYDSSISTGTQSNINVTPSNATSFVVEIATNQTVGVMSKVITVEAKDPYGNTDTNYSSGGSTWTITFTSDDTGADFDFPPAPDDKY
ncbi:unnamed protein product, partial [marine sediment metagenome]